MHGNLHAVVSCIDCTLSDVTGLLCLAHVKELSGLQLADVPLHIIC